MENHSFTTTSLYLHPVEAFTSRDQASKSFKICLNISFREILSHWIIQENPQDVVVSHDFPIMIDNFVIFTLKQLLSYKRSRKAIKEIVKDWPIRNNLRRQFIDVALKRARQAIISMPAHHNVVSLDFFVTSQIINFLDQRQFSEEESTGCMVPTLNFCIENLERNVVIDHDHKTCSICLEEFIPINGVRKGTCMPCSHIFHDDCIRKWLSTSHYCPMCRFEMPTAEDP